MIAQAIESITELAKQAQSADAAAKLIPHPADPHRKVAIVSRDGQVREEALAPPPRNDSLETFGDVSAVALGRPKSAVWFSEKKVVVEHDRSDGRDIATFAWRPTPVLEWAISAAQGRKYAQKQLIALLRFTLWDALQVEDQSRTEILQTVRTIKTTVQRGTSVTAQVGRESMGRTLEAEIAGEQRWTAEEFFLADPLWFGTSGRAFKLRIGVETEVTDDGLTFVLAPIELRPTLNDALDLLYEDLGDQIAAGEAESRSGDEKPDAIPVLRGLPGSR